MSALLAPLVSPLLAGWMAAASCTGCTAYLAGDAWQGYETTALSLGKMRLERAPEGLPVSRRGLAENFRRIAFGIEHDVLDPADPAVSDGGTLRRWQRPVRVNVTSLGDDADVHRDMVSEVANRIAVATRHPIQAATAQHPANLAVLFLRPEDYGPAGDALRKRAGGGWLARQVEAFGRAQHTPCVGIFLHAETQEAGRPDEIIFALALIRAGLPPRLGRACIEEEMAQAMGLPNDDPYVRPSVFNDDQEFALLTGHDEALLRILYDARLSPGMSESEAMEIVPEIIGEMDIRVISGRARINRTP
ncbi:MAG: DUF2927 domain-containing protein [Pseudomonadota bacterium]